jgi:hypothetical protein
MLFELTPLPPIDKRELVGVWRLLGVPAKMTRSIERVRGEYFLVSRWIDPDGNRAGGADGIRLEKLSDRVYQHSWNPHTSVLISPEGHFSMASDVDTMYGEPCEELWPK